MSGFFLPEKVSLRRNSRRFCERESSSVTQRAILAILKAAKPLFLAIVKAARPFSKFRKVSKKFVTADTLHNLLGGVSAVD